VFHLDETLIWHGIIPELSRNYLRNNSEAGPATGRPR